MISTGLRRAWRILGLSLRLVTSLSAHQTEKDERELLPQMWSSGKEAA